MISEFVDMDTQKIRYVSESSNASTSGYSTMSPGPNYGGIQRNGNLSPSSSSISMPSPTQSPVTASLHAEFSNLNFVQIQQHNHLNTTYTNLTNPTITGLPNNGNILIHQQYLSQQPLQQQQTQFFNTNTIADVPEYTTLSHCQPIQMKNEYKAELHIIEQPVEKFRFRYKSEMHGTHGSLNGANSKGSPKTYPEVELCKYNGRAIIRCSLFQTNLESPHSHQLVVRKDDTDTCDPHELEVSPEKGFVARFHNMGIIHTAKKFIFDELLKKKTKRLQFETGRNELSTKQIQELHKETEKEAKDMNLNQVRLCFEAFKREENNTWTRIAAPVYTNFINNRKSAQTGELRIVRLSIAAGSVKGGDDLILLVEKVSKKNIKVRFYELNDDDETIWEAFGNFRECDVHHQYAIVCRTPPYKEKNIDKPVEVNIELVRPTDDERSFPPVSFRYKPDVTASRKRRRTYSTATSSSGSGSSVNSFEVPKTVQDQQLNMSTNVTHTLPNDNINNQGTCMGGITISAEFGRDQLIASAEFTKMINCDSEELHKLYSPEDIFEVSESIYKCLEVDGATSHLETDGATSMEFDSKKIDINKILSSDISTTTSDNSKQSIYLQRITKIFDEARSNKKLSQAEISDFAKQITEFYFEYADINDGNSIMHDVVIKDNAKIGFKLCCVLNFFKLNNLLNCVLNSNNESALHYACLHDRTLFIRPLLGLGCDPDLLDNRGNSALHIAVQEQNINCINSFLNTKTLRVNLTIRNDKGLTPLHLAIRLKFYDAVKKFIEYDPSSALVPNNIDGNNALHMAVLQQNLNLIETILDVVIDKSAILASRNIAGQTAKQLSKKFNTKVGTEITQLLSISSSKDDDDSDEIGDLAIKEEEMSSSSGDEDGFEESISVSINKDIIKQEYNYKNDEKKGKKSNTEESVMSPKESKNLAEILQNDQKCEKLSKILNDQDKWRIVAKKCNIKQFLCLWSKAEDLISYIKNQKNVNYELFAAILAELDRDALEILQTP